MESAIIGRVRVKISPDTSDFKRDLKEELRKAMAGIEPEVPVDLDKDHIKEEARKLKKELEDELDNLKAQVGLDENHLKEQASRLADQIEERLDNLDATIELNRDGIVTEARRIAEKVEEELDNLKAHVDLDEDATLIREAHKLGDRIEEALDNLHVKNLDLNVAEVLKDARELRRDIDRVLDDVDITVKLDGLEEFKRETRARKKDLEDLAKEWKAKIQVSMESGGLRKSTAQLAFLARDRIVSIIPKVSKVALAKATAALGGLTGATGVKNYFKDISDGLENIINNAPRISLIATAIGGLVTQLGAAATNAFSLGGSLATVAGAAFTLPAILTGVVTGLIATVVAFSQLADRMPDVYEGWYELRGIIGDNFWAKAEKPLRSLSEAILPAFQKGLGEVSTALGNFFGTLANGFKKNLLPDLPPMFTNLAKAINVASGAANGIAKIIGVLGSTGSEYLPILAANFVKVTDRFAEFLDKARDSGELRKWIDDGIAGIKELWNIATGAAGILSGLAKAANNAGGSTLSTLGKSLHDIADTVNSPTFQKAMTGAMEGFLKGAKIANDEAGPALSKMFLELSKTAQTALPQIGSAFGNLLGGIADAIAAPGFQSGLQSLISGLSTGLKGARPYWDDIGEGIGALAKIVGNMAKDALPFLAKAFAGVSKIIDGLEPYIGKLTDSFFSFANDALDTLLPILQDLIPYVGDFMDTLGSLLPQVTPLVKPLLELGSTALKAVLDSVSDIIKTGAFGALATALGDLLKGVTPLIPDLVRLGNEGILTVAKVLGQMSKDGSLDKLIAGITSLLTSIQPLLGPIADLVEQLVDLNLKSGALGIVVGTIGTAFNILGGILNAVFSGMALGITAFNNLGTASQVVSQAIGTTVVTAAQKLGEAIQWLTDKMSGIADKIQNAFIDAGNILKDVGVKIITGLYNGMISVLSKVLNWLDDLTGWIVDHKGPPSKDATLLYPAGQSIITGLLNGMKNVVGSVLKWLGNLTGDIKDKFAKAGTWLVEKGKSLINGLKNGADNAKDALQEKLSGIISNARGKFDGAATWLTSKGSALINGLKNGANDAKTSLQEKLSGIITNVKDKFSSAGTWLVSKGSSLINGLRDGISNAKTNVTDKLAGLKDSILGKFSSAATWLTSAGKDIINSLKDGIGWNISDVTYKIGDLRYDIPDALGNAWNLLYDAGKDIAQGLANGISAGWRWVYNAARGIAKDAVDAAKSALGIHSPSRVFRGLGEYTSEGFAEGMKSNYDMVKDAASGLGDVAAKAVKKVPIKAGLTVSGSSFAGGDDLSGVGSGGGINVFQTNYNPVAEPGSVKVNKALQTLGAFGIGEFAI